MASQFTIGEGGSGKVKKITDANGFTYAVKTQLDGSVSRNELEIVKLLYNGNRNRHIVNFLDCFQAEGNIYLYMEWASEGSMVNFVRSSSTTLKNDAGTLTLLQQLWDGLRFLHSEKQILHHDIKPDNILVFAEGSGYLLKFSDFGISKRMSDPTSMSYGYRSNARIGTYQYMAPELFDSNPKYSKSSDIWSLGATMMFWLNNGQHYFDGNSDQNVISKICSWQGFSEKENERYSETHQRSFGYISKMLVANPNTRAGT